MLFSHHYGVLHTSSDDWFDPILNVDTPLFIDPFLIFCDTDPRWSGAHERIVDHFSEAFKLLADCGCDPTAQAYKSAVRMVQFPEPYETSLGYVSTGTRGSGGGGTLARFIARAMCDAIGRGVEELRHFEQLGIFEEGIGPDRISDITTTILKPELIAYTQDIASHRGIKLESHQVRAAAFDSRRHGFTKASVALPTNPATDGPLILVPQRFLSELPAINSDDWWNDMRATELRDEFNAEITGRVPKKEIIKIAKRHPDKVAAWVEAREATRGTPYDLERDPRGIYAWAAATRRHTRTHPLSLPAATDDASFFSVVDRIVAEFKHFVEESGGWRLLWDGDHDKNEEAIQLLFFGMAQAYCQANDIVVDREVQLGRGPVDFKFSSGYTNRALLEVKKLDNGKFWNGLRHQLPSYLKSDKNRHGWLLAVQHRSTGVSKDRARTLQAEVRRVATELDLDLRYAVVDARPKKSASKLTDADADADTGAA